MVSRALSQRRKKVDNEFAEIPVLHQHDISTQREHRPTLLQSSEQKQSNNSKLRRGKSLLQNSSSIDLSASVIEKDAPIQKKSDVCASCWTLYCYVMTFYAPPILLSACGKRSLLVQRAWRDKMGLISVIIFISALIGYLSFGFNQSICDLTIPRVHASELAPGVVASNGNAYLLDDFRHPAAYNIPANSNPLYPPVNASGKDISFLFQKVNQRCLNQIRVKPGVDWGQDINGRVPNYFPCVFFDRKIRQVPNPKLNPHRIGCHTSDEARLAYYALHPLGKLYYTWEDLKKEREKTLIVYNNDVLNLDLLHWIPRDIFNLPPLFESLLDPIVTSTLAGTDATFVFLTARQKRAASCLVDITRVGVIETHTLGCLISEILLYLELTVILGVMACKFLLAVAFRWFLSWRLGSFKRDTREERLKREKAIEEWSCAMVDPVLGPSSREPSRFFSDKLRLSLFGRVDSGSSLTLPLVITQESPRNDTAQSLVNSSELGSSTPSLECQECPSRNSTSSLLSQLLPVSPYVIPQPDPSFQPFGFPLLYTMCLVTCYSEGEAGIRTTLDSLATADYPGSHKLLIVIADGEVKGEGNDTATPTIILEMMQDLIIPRDQVQPKSYVAIAEGTKKHNMAKVYAGFYKYDNATVRRSRQVRVPMVLIAKCGTPEESTGAKPGNRGKRDSQVMLMTFLQRVMFDERMTPFEYELFNGIWAVTGVLPDSYEILLMVDADTKIFPDSISRMVSAMERDPEIMGLCGETKIGNKTSSWVTAMQVFEYYISHHLNKAFESVFGGVTCLPGCFSMYRIKSPKHMSFWVPILANPEIIVRYSEYHVDTLHKKNLLLLGEDRYLTTLMLSTFPRRKMVFVPQAVCKTVVPDSFRVLLSQRRRWINSTVHNLMELILVRDLCGTFCFSMQFIVFLELLGTVFLPAGILFTIYLIVVCFYSMQSLLTLMVFVLILGLPAVLAVVIAGKIVYIWWMAIYLVSLPIWNFILPAYAFWHFDDFSWGQTRKVEGEKSSDVRAGHDDGGKEFDGRQIVMKRWAEFERERRGFSNGKTKRIMKKRQANNCISKPIPVSNSHYDLRNLTIGRAFNEPAPIRHVPLTQARKTNMNTIDTEPTLPVLCSCNQQRNEAINRNRYSDTLSASIAMKTKAIMNPSTPFHQHQRPFSHPYPPPIRLPFHSRSVPTQKVSLRTSTLTSPSSVTTVPRLDLTQPAAEDPELSCTISDEPEGTDKRHSQDSIVFQQLDVDLATVGNFNEDFETVCLGYGIDVFSVTTKENAERSK
ncbi:uncharacterized protein VTP21DRAFT_6190 [Calcarisporiella thermophila]|uniref:uncharacterized protein n=1 Tax=Calcarisporiella thermophila TaxID=911321 RepID=UPI0037438BA1